MARKPLPSLAPDRVRQKALDVLQAAGGALTRDKLRVGISGALKAAQLDQTVDQLAREGLIEVREEQTLHQGIQGDRSTYPVRVYRLTPRGKSAAGGSKG